MPYLDYGYRVTFFGDEIEEIESIELSSSKRISTIENAAIFPATLYLAPKEMILQVMNEIQDEMMAQVQYFKSIGKIEEAQRIKERVEYDLEMKENWAIAMVLKIIQGFLIEENQVQDHFVY